jgi:hypothetical protein
MQVFCHVHSLSYVPAARILIYVLIKSSAVSERNVVPKLLLSHFLLGLLNIVLKPKCHDHYFGECSRYVKEEGNSGNVYPQKTTSERNKTLA